MGIKKTQCPLCGNPIFVESQWEGIDLDCPFCQQVFTLPREARTAPENAFWASQFSQGAEKETDPAYIEPANCFTALKKYFRFRGRASRREYWLFSMLVTLCFFLLNVAALKIFSNPLRAAATANIIMVVAFLLPAWGVTVRRLHDIGLSGWWLLLSIIPYIGNLIILVMVSLPSQLQDNKYGQNPNGFHPDQAWPAIVGWLLPLVLVLCLTV